VNPANPQNLITGANDWNFNDGCAVNATFDGGKTWTPTLPDGFLPGITKFTNDPKVPGDGATTLAAIRRSRRITWTGIASPQPLNLEIEYATITP
jgi:hypothetical protein